MFGKRIITVLLCAVFMGLLVPGGVFGGGKTDDGDAGSKKTAASKKGSETTASSETSLQGSGQEVAWVQLDPKKKKESILLGQLKAQVEQLERATQQPIDASGRLQVLDVMVNTALALQAAEQESITVSTGELDQYIGQLKAQMAQAMGRQPSDEEFAQVIRNQTGLDEQAFREQSRKDAIVERYLQAKKKALFEAIKAPTDEAIRAYFNNARNDFIRPQTVGISMIMIPYGADAAAKQKAKTTADRLNREIGSTPSRFDDTYQKGTGARNMDYMAVPGYLSKNTISQEQMGQEFVEAAFRLRQGQVSPLIEGRQGYSIIKVTEEFVEKKLELDDIIEVGTRVTVRDAIGNRLLQQQAMDVRKQASEELIAELRAKNGGKSFQINEKNLNW